MATPVPFTDLSRDGESFGEARGRALEAARARLADLSGTLRADLSRDAIAELASVAVTVSPERSAEKLALTVSVVLISTELSSGGVYLVYAPGLPGFSVAASDREPALTLAKRSLEDVLESWQPGGLLPLDTTGAVELTPMTVPYRTDSQPAADIAMDDLTELAADGKLSRLDRRDPLVERVLAVLAADGRASVLLVGASDVGKTTLTNEVAARLASDDVPPALTGRRLLRITANELIAGARFTGMWQERAKQLINAGRRTGAIIAMGDPGAIVDAGRWSGSDNNLARVLRPYVESGELRLICEATEEGVAAVKKLEPSFVEVFYRVEVPEPDTDSAREILRAAARRLEANHDVTFEEDAVQASLDLTRRFEPYRALPGKAVRLLEETAQLIAVHSAQRLGREDVTRGFAQRTGMPIGMLSDQVALRIDEVRAFFEERVLGQADAVEAMVDLIAVIKAALGDSSKPLSTLFFVGPTGVGKTELTKALAEYLFGSRDRVLRFDMGEYASGDAAPRLIGSAWDRNGDGELTRRVREQPFCVVLLDEVEKAHGTVFDVLLPALGEGRITDATGRTADLRNAIVIMTSNLGAATSGSRGLGFARGGDDEERASSRNHFITEAERFFRPEFFNRIDRVLAFAPLGQETINRIARRELGRLLLREGITRRQLLVEIDDQLVDRLGAAGFHPRYGARPLHREIERAVIRPLARLIVEQLPQPGDLIRITDGGEEVRLSVHRVREPARAAGRSASGAVAKPKAADGTSARAAADARGLLEEIHGHERGSAAIVISAELTRLLERVNHPGFWDDQDTARTTMMRIYQLQRLTDRMHHLRSRAEGLVELAETLKGKRDRVRLPELRSALGEVEDGLAVLRLEQAGAAAGDDEPAAVLTFTPIGADARRWAARLAEMYVAWAGRTGRTAVRSDSEPLTLTIEGPGSCALLAGEAGLHRNDGAEGSRVLVRVGVWSPDDERRHGAESGLVVRIYAEGARTGVRDTRTGVTVGSVQAVLEHGRIDDFLVAAAMDSHSTPSTAARHAG